jgi:predicted alpha/beta superfamily hydrolase
MPINRSARTQLINLRAFVLFILLAVFGSCSAQESKVTFKVITPHSTPRGAPIFIAGNHPLLGDWNPGKVQLQKENDSLWTISLKFPKGSRLEFKITRGSWNTQAVYEDRVVPPNIQLSIGTDTTLTIRPMDWSDNAFSSGGGIVGTVNYHRAFRGTNLKYERDAIVWLPPSYYKDLRKRYPVLYMHDGQNIIDPATSFIGYDWHVDEVADSLIRSGKVDELVVVGVYNTADRIAEYSDTDLGRSYALFVINELKPFIDKTYRTKPDRENTAVMGSSLGGLISFLFVWWYPDVFSEAGCLSSAFLADSDKILKEVQEYTGAKKNIRIYLDCGSEGLEARLKPGYDEMIKVLKEKGYKEGIDLEYYFDQGAEHNERAWADRLWRPLVFMFGK